MQLASAASTPTFQATSPEILPDEEEYTNALSLLRLACDPESLLSPMLAALLLTVISFHWLFADKSVGFVVSALLVITSALPRDAMWRFLLMACHCHIARLESPWRRSISRRTLRCEFRRLLLGFVVLVRRDRRRGNR